jgi:hypothetical protein
MNVAGREGHKAGLGLNEVVQRVVEVGREVSKFSRLSLSPCSPSKHSQDEVSMS